MRLLYFALDRADLGEPEMFSQANGKANTRKSKDLKKVARYFLGTKHMALHLWRQTFPKCIFSLAYSGAC